MRRNSLLVTLVLAFVVAMLRPAMSAPMFPDVPDMWAKDAVAALAAKGILEGYPDGTFKGDRAATRYEVAMIVARLLAKMEQEHATFATKADLEELRKLVNQLREELDALGVRVQNLEDNVAKLDKRVTELERITFYGSIDARWVSMTMGNRGLTSGINGDQTGTGLGGLQVAPLAAAFAGTTAAVIPTVFTTSVGVPMAFLPSTFTIAGVGGTPVLIGGRPVAVNGFVFNTSSFNTANLGFLAGFTRPSYNLVAGSNRSNGGDSVTAAAGLAVPPATVLGGNPFTGLTGAMGNTFGAPLVIPAFEVRTGRPWTQGTGGSGQGILGVRIHLNEDMEAGAEFAAFYSTGDPIVDAFYGVSPRRLMNVFAGDQGLGLTGLDGGQGIHNSPWNRMDIDNFWFLHKPSNIKVQIGGYGDTHMDGIVYLPEYNPNYFGPKYLDNFGFRVSGSHHFLTKFDWEIFGSNVADGNRLLTDYPGAVALGAINYKPYLWGADFKWTIGEEGNQGRIKFDVMRIWEGNSSGAATTVGSVVGMNGVWTDWANPSGFFVNQINPTGLLGNTAGIGSTSDIRPIIPNVAGNPAAFGTDTTGSGTFGAAASPLLAGAGLPVSFLNPTSSFGPQSQFSWGVTAGWNYSWNDDIKMRLFGEYGNSSYKPSMNSSYEAPNGHAYRVGLGFTLFSDWDIDGEYVNVNPFYSPFIAQYPNVMGVTQAYWRLPSLSWFPEAYPVSDKDIYPNNREGFRVFAKWNPVDPKDGKHKTVLWGEYGNMDQQTTSLQGVRFSPGSIFTSAAGALTPNGYALGQLPGFIDTVFTGLSPNSYTTVPGVGGTNVDGSFPAFSNFAGSNPANFNEFARALENPRGRVTNWGVGGDYRFDALNGLLLHVGYRNYQFQRPTSLPPAFGGNENNINLDLQGGLVSLAYPINERFSIKGGYAWTNIRGHYDPTGIYRNFSLDTGNVNFRTFDNDQTCPFVGFDYDVARNVNWNMTAKFLDSHDNLGTFSTPNFFLQRNPFSWSGIQVTSEVKVSF